VQTEGSLPDHVPPERDRVNLAGNFVAIDCKGVRVLLAHLKQGSVSVKSGATVTESQQLGQIGNSGNTDEPHLHVHAERPVDPTKLLDAEPVPMRFDKRSRARNDRIRAY
jgi:murein DD-endopeptidase MepM/ murein hydrolase activator NlpD